MSERSPDGTQGPSPSEVERMARACANFEEAWRKGERPDLEQSLAAAGPNADQLLERLLSLELTCRVNAGEEPKPEEYLSRFPASRGLVEAAFAELSTAAGLAGGTAGVGVGGTSRNLLVGILALQNGFIDHASLIAAIQAWAADKSRRLGEILIRADKLDARQLELLEALAEEHRRRYGDDVHKSLAAFGSLAPVIRAVEGMGDPDVEASLTTPPPSTAGDPDLTTAHDEPGADPGRDRGRGEEWRGGSWSSSRFRILNFHDAGMLGRVFIALDQELNRNVALKEIQDKHAHHPVSRGQFVLEGMVTGALEHPGIVPVYSLGTHEDGSPFYAMRFIQGPSLRDKLKQLHGAADAQSPTPGEPPVTLPRLLRHFVSACQAMAYAHSRGVLHRDLKPDHILLGPFGETLVVDWGLAMPIPRKEGETAAAGESIHLPPGYYDTALGQDGVVVGTVAYMSPEQAAGFISRMDQTSDVYALGAILYAILTGKAPFSGGDFATMLGRVRRGEFSRPREVDANIPPALEAVCLKAMSHGRVDRYATAADLAQDVERWLDDEPTIAFSEPLWTRAGRWLRRHRTAAASLAAGLLCSVVGLIALNLQMRSANAAISRERNQTELARVEAVTARDQAVAARDQAVVARDQREANFRATLEAVNGYLRRIVEARLPTIPGATKLREEIAAVTATLLDKLWKQKPEDPEVRYMAGRAYREHGNIQRLLGRAAENSYERSLDLLRGSIASRADVPKYRDYLAETLNDIARNYQLANLPDLAKPYLIEAHELAVRLREQQPAEPNYQRTEARSALALADNQMLIGEFDDARRLAEKALGAIQPLADGDRPGPFDRMDVVSMLCTLSEALEQSGKPDDACTHLDDALRRAEGMMSAVSPNVVASDLKLARGYARTILARAQAAGGRGAEARTTIDAAVAEFDALVGEQSGIVHYGSNLSEALIVRAERLVAAGAAADARHDLDRAQALLLALLKISPANATYSGLLGRAVGRLGLLDLKQEYFEAARARLTRAVELQKVPLKTNPKSPPDRRALVEWEAALATIPAAPG